MLKYAKKSHLSIVSSIYDEQICFEDRAGFHPSWPYSFGDSYSEPFLTTLGVKQGDSLTPTLFNIFVDDIKSSLIDNTKTKPVSLGVHTFNHLLYADNLVILSESPTGLQHCINALDNYCEKWRLNINIKKKKL